MEKSTTGQLPVNFSIEWMTPNTTSRQRSYMLDYVHFRMSVVVEKSDRRIDPEDFQCQLWTNMYHKEYNEGDWHAVDMTFQDVRIEKDNNKVTLVYGVQLLPTCLGQYGFTYRARRKSQQDDNSTTQWTAGFKRDGQVDVVLPVKDSTLWIQEHEESHINANIYLGNYKAALSAPENGFDCMLNMADDAPIYTGQLCHPVIYRQWLVAAGADKPIPERTICEAVNWLRSMSDRCGKVLVFSRRGYGRAGSVMLAYIFAYNRNLSFEEVLRYVQKRHFVYSHRGLRETLYRMYIRE